MGISLKPPCLFRLFELVLVGRVEASKAGARFFIHFQGFPMPIVVVLAAIPTDIDYGDWHILTFLIASFGHVRALMQKGGIVQLSRVEPREFQVFTP